MLDIKHVTFMIMMMMMPMMLLLMIIIMMMMMMVMMTVMMMMIFDSDFQVQDITHVTWRKGDDVLDLHSEERVR